MTKTRGKVARAKGKEGKAKAKKRLPGPKVADERLRKVTLSASVPRAVKEALEQRSAKTGQRVGEIVADACRKYLGC